MRHTTPFRWIFLLIALLISGCVRPAPVPGTPTPASVSTEPPPPAETAIPTTQATVAAPSELENWGTVTDAAYGYAFKLPPVWEMCGETPFSRQYCMPAEPGGVGQLPSFYATFIPAGFTNPEGEAYNFLPEESVRSLLDLAVGDTLVIPPDAEPAEYFTYSRLPDQPVGAWKAAVIENERVWEAPAETKDRRALIETDAGALLLGSYYTTPEELNLYEKILANLEFTPPPVAEATPEPQATSGQIYLPQVLRSGGRMEDRTTADRPDEVAGYQVHVVYVLPSDGTDRGLDVDGTLAASIGSVQNWLLQQTGEQTLRLDTFAGAIDITFRRLDRPDAEIASHGIYARDTIETELQASGLNNPQKLYAVYYDGTSYMTCSGGAWPPDLVGNVAILFLKGLAQSDFPCNVNSFVPYPEAPPGYPEYAMLQEIFHTLGAPAVCAPHHSSQGHIADSLTDLMYSGEESWVQRELDTGRDDYWGHGNPDCPDLARSVFIDPLPEGAQLPPGW